MSTSTRPIRSPSVKNTGDSVAEEVAEIAVGASVEMAGETVKCSASQSRRLQ